MDGWRTTRMLSLRGESGAKDAAIHRILRKANGFVYSLTGSQWIATGLRPRDDKVSKEWQCAVRLYHDLCHCEEKA